jgi:hypothetical protein
MKIGIILSFGALVAAAVAVALPAQDAKLAVPGGQDQAAMLEAMHQAGIVGEPHRDLARYIGTWQVSYSCFAGPGAPPAQGSGTSTFESILGGRYLVEHASGTMPQMGPFQGEGILGFNNTTGEYEQVWLCDAGTSIMTAHGRKGGDGALTLTSETVDPLTKAKLSWRLVWSDLSSNERHFEMFASASGKETKMMEAVYTRGQVGMR